MAKEKLKSKIYRKRRWTTTTPLHSNLNKLEEQVSDITKFIIEDLIFVDKQSEERIINTEQELTTQIVKKEKKLSDQIIEKEEKLSNRINESKTQIKELIRLFSFMSEDNKIDEEEKNKIKKEMGIIASDYKVIKIATDELLINSKDFSKYYEELLLYITPIIDSNGDTEVSGITFKFKFQNFLNSKQLMLSLIAEKRLEKSKSELYKRIDSSQKTIDELVHLFSYMAEDNKIDPQEKIKIKNELIQLNKDFSIIISEADKYKVKHQIFENTYKELLTYINPIIDDSDSTTEVSGVTFKFKFQNYFNSKQLLMHEIGEKNLQESKVEIYNRIDQSQAIIDELSRLFAIMADDNKIDQQEKRRIQEELVKMKNEFKELVKEAETLLISSLDFETKYNDLVKYITPIIKEVNTLSEVSGIEFKFKFQNYFNSKQLLLSKIMDVKGSKIITQIQEELSKTDTDLNLKIKQTNESVNEKTKSEAILAEINVSATGLKIKAEKIAIGDGLEINRGKVTVNNLNAKVITSGEIDAEKIKVHNLNAENITVGRINGKQIKEFAIVDEHIKNLNAGKLIAKSITADKIAIGAIGETQISDGVITTKKISVDGIDARTIKTGILEVGESLKIKGIIDGNEANFKNINAESITVGKINGQQMADRTITSANIKTGTIESANIKELDAKLLKTGIIDAEKINVVNINANEIKSGVISANRLDVGENFSVENGNLKVEKIDASAIKSGFIEGARIKAGTITSEKFAEGALSATIIEGGSITADQIKTGSITADKMSTKGLDASILTSGEIDAKHIKVKNLSAENIVTEGITADVIKGGTIASSTLITTNGNETTTIAGGSIIFSRNGENITTFRNMVSASVKTDGKGSGYYDFKNFKQDLIILPSLKGFNVSANVRSLNCRVEKDPSHLAENRHKFFIYGTEEKYSGTEKVTQKSQEFSIDAYSAGIESVTFNLSTTASLEVIYHWYYLKNLSFTTITPGEISFKIFINDNYYGETISTFDGNNFSLPRRSSKLVCNFNKKVSLSNFNLTTEKKEIKKLKIEAYIKKNALLHFRGIREWSQSDHDGSHTERRDADFNLSTSANNSNLTIKEVTYSYTTSAISNIIGDGEVQFIAIEK